MEHYMIHLPVSTGHALVDGVGFWCPGCEEMHCIYFGLPGGWTNDGTEEKPTIRPSLLVQYGTRPGDKRCHSFITDGRWEYLSDTTHRLAGQSVPMVAIPETSVQ